MSEELKPCPFCGGKCELTKGYCNSGQWEHGTFHRVFCTVCQCRQLFHMTPSEAISAWNSRATVELSDDAKDAERIDALPKILAKYDFSEIPAGYYTFFPKEYSQPFIVDRSYKNFRELIDTIIAAQRGES